MSSSDYHLSVFIRSLIAIALKAGIFVGAMSDNVAICGICFIAYLIYSGFYIAYVFPSIGIGVGIGAMAGASSGSPGLFLLAIYWAIASAITPLVSIIFLIWSLIQFFLDSGSSTIHTSSSSTSTHSETRSSYSYIDFEDILPYVVIIALLGAIAYFEDIPEKISFAVHDEESMVMIIRGHTKGCKAFDKHRPYLFPYPLKKDLKKAGHYLQKYEQAISEGKCREYDYLNSVCALYINLAMAYLEEGDESHCSVYLLMASCQGNTSQEKFESCRQVADECKSRAEKGGPHADFLYSRAYNFYVRAVNWYYERTENRDSYKRGHYGDCYYQLGQLEELGLGCKKSIVQAKENYQRAAQAGCQEARAALNRLEPPAPRKQNYTPRR